MREIRTSGSEGGAGRKPRSYLYLDALRLGNFSCPSVIVTVRENISIQSPLRRTR
jgi:hypothetical protein